PTARTSHLVSDQKGMEAYGWHRVSGKNSLIDVVEPNLRTISGVVTKGRGELTFRRSESDGSATFACSWAISVLTPCATAILPPQEIGAHMVYVAISAATPPFSIKKAGGFGRRLFRRHATSMGDASFDRRYSIHLREQADLDVVRDVVTPAAMVLITSLRPRLVTVIGNRVPVGRGASRLILPSSVRSSAPGLEADLVRPTDSFLILAYSGGSSATNFEAEVVNLLILANLLNLR